MTRVIAARSRRLFGGVVVLLALGASGSCAPGEPAAADGSGPRVPGGHGTVAVEGVGLRTPSSIVYDRRADVYLVANRYDGPRDGKAGGFVSRGGPMGRSRRCAGSKRAPEAPSSTRPEGW